METGNQLTNSKGLVTAPHRLLLRFLGLSFLPCSSSMDSITSQQPPQLPPSPVCCEVGQTLPHSICKGLVPGAPADTSILRCANPLCKTGWYWEYSWPSPSSGSPPAGSPSADSTPNSQLLFFLLPPKISIQVHYVLGILLLLTWGKRTRAKKKKMKTV